MLLAETVTFAGGNLNRRADLRKSPEHLAAALQSGAGRVMVLWRGKPLMQPDGALIWLDEGHPMLADAAPERLFLGESEGALRFAADLSAWQAPADQAPAAGGFLDPSQQRHPAAPEEALFCELRMVMLKLGRCEAELAVTAKAMFAWHRSHSFCSRCGVASQWDEAGWHRVCPACNSIHFPRTDPVVIMLVTHGNDLLLGRSPGWPPGMYSLLAGYVELGETMEAAVRREVLEEAGIQVGAVGYLSSQPWPFPASLMFGCWAEATTREITLDPVELEDALWISREELMQAFAGQHPKVKPARKGAIAHFLMQNWLADRLG